MIVYPSPKVLAIAAIRPVAGVPVVGDIPATRPEKFIRVLHTGGTSNDIALEHHIIVLEAYAKKESDAWDLIQLARGAVLESDTFNHAYQTGNPYPNPDKDGTPRYAVTLGVAIRGIDQ